MVGQFGELERKSIEPIALNVENGQLRAMQRAMSDAIWDESKMLAKYRSMVAEDMGHPSGVLIFDESGVLKKGDYSAGAAKQYCGTVGKVENSQVGVFAAYASPAGYTLLDKRLFIPEKWFSSDYEEKRKKCDMPEDLEFKTKPQLAVEMLSAIDEEHVIPYTYIASDTIYGHSPDFIDAVEQLPGKIYFVSIASDTKCWLKNPMTRMKTYKYRGKTQKKRVLEDTAKKPITVDEIARNVNNYFWYRRTVSEGTKGPIKYEFHKRRVTLSKNGLPWKNGMAYFERNES